MWRLSLNLEFGHATDEQPEREGSADALTERADQYRPIGFYPTSDPTRRDPED